MRAPIVGAIAVALAVPAVAAAAIRPTVRIEGAAVTTLPEVRVPVATTGTVAVADTTDTDSITVDARSATAQAGTATGLFGLQLGFDLFDFGGPSSFITQLGADKMPPSFSPSWRLKVDHKLTATGSDTTRLEASDSVLWSFVTDFETPELDLTVPRRLVRAGATFTAHVTRYDNNGVATPAAGAAVRFGGTTRTADVYGDATFTAPAARGPRFVSATLAGAVRSQVRLVCVTGTDGRPCSAITAPVPAVQVPAPQAVAGLATAPFVDVAVAKREGAACRFLTRDRSAFGAAGACGTPTWIRVAVRDGHWLLPVVQAGSTAPLAPGRYLLRSRAVAGTRREAVVLAGANSRNVTAVAVTTA